MAAASLLIKKQKLCERVVSECIDYWVLRHYFQLFLYDGEWMQHGAHCQFYSAKY